MLERRLGPAPRLGDLGEGQGNRRLKVVKTLIPMDLGAWDVGIFYSTI